MEVTGQGMRRITDMHTKPSRVKKKFMLPRYPVGKEVRFEEKWGLSLGR